MNELLRQLHKLYDKEPQKADPFGRQKPTPKQIQDHLSNNFPDLEPLHPPTIEDIREKND